MNIFILVLRDDFKLVIKMYEIRSIFYCNSGNIWRKKIFSIEKNMIPIL